MTNIFMNAVLYGAVALGAGMIIISSLTALFKLEKEGKIYWQYVLVILTNISVSIICVIQCRPLLTSRNLKSISIDECNMAFIGVLVGYILAAVALDLMHDVYTSLSHKYRNMAVRVS